jgi:hypothetical protein
MSGRGAERTRTADFLLAKQVLYQLSYRPHRNVSLAGEIHSAGRKKSMCCCE